MIPTVHNLFELLNSPVKEIPFKLLTSYLIINSYNSTYAARPRPSLNQFANKKTNE